MLRGHCAKTMSLRVRELSSLRCNPLLRLTSPALILSPPEPKTRRGHISVSLLCALLSFLGGGCGIDDYDKPLEVAVSPSSGTIQTAEFRIWHATHYDLFLGVEPVPTTESTCIAAIPTLFNGEKLPIPSDRPCKALAPPTGAVDWVVSRSGRVIASGSAPAASWDWPNTYPQSPVYWRQIGGLRAESGGHYTIKISIHQDAKTPDDVHMHVMVAAPFK
jgi:hypothetical protein